MSQQKKSIQKIQWIFSVCLGYETANDVPFTFIDRKAARRRIETLHDEHETLLQSIINKQMWICLTADIWSCKNRSFLGVSVHYMDNDLRRKSYVISCKYFPAPHNYKTITESFQLLYSKFGIKSKSVVATVTDNGSNFVKAFQIFGRNNEDFIKFLQLNESDDLDQPMDHFEDDDRSQIFEILNSLYEEPDQVDVDLESDALFELLNSTATNDTEYERQNSCDTNGKPEQLQQFYRSRITNIELDYEAAFGLSNRISCNAHNFNLVGSKDSLRAHRNKAYSKIYGTVFEKLNMLWNNSGRQEPSQIIMKHLGSNLNKPSNTRWNDIHEKVIDNKHPNRFEGIIIFFSFSFFFFRYLISCSVMRQHWTS